VADLLVRRVPDSLVRSLKQRAAQHRRSLQQELVGILESAVEEPPNHNPAQIAAAIRTRLRKTGRTFSDSTRMIREDRRR